MLPLGYLLLRAFEADFAEILGLVFRVRNLLLLFNTLVLAAGVLTVGSLIAFPLAWLTARTDLPGKRWITLLGVLPLAMPGYVMAYALLGLGGEYGTMAQLFGVTFPRLSGYWGAMIAISLYTFPYLFLNLRAGLSGLDPALEETARSFGYSPSFVFFRVILPQLRPAFLAGGLLIGLYVLGDFGAVALMRFETFSYALYLQYTASYDRVYAALLALMLLTLASAALYLEFRLLKGRIFHRTGTGTARRTRIVALGRWKPAVWLFLVSVATAAILVPMVTIGHWMSLRTGAPLWQGLQPALSGSIMASAPAAFLAGALALPLAYLGIRYPSSISRALERVAYLGYATPPLALALALIFFSLRVTPFLYQTLLLLIAAYVLRFLAEAVGPVRTALYQAPPKLEEAARSLGFSQFIAFFRVTLPLLKRGLLVSIAFVFLSAMKELPITFLLAPIGFETLALNVWSYSMEAMFAHAAPYALTIVVFSAGFVALLLMQEGRRK